MYFCKGNTPYSFFYLLLSFYPRLTVGFKPPVPIFGFPLFSAIFISYLTVQKCDISSVHLLTNLWS